MRKNSIRDESGKFMETNSPITDRNWLYQKYVVERLSWNDFYNRFGISYFLLHCKLKEFEMKRPRINWNLGLIGQQNPNWKEHKVTPIKKLLRRHTLYIEWKKEIFERDNYTCQICKKRGGVLHIDHYPKTFYQILLENNITTFEGALECDELWNIKNGRTLCEDCHRKTPTWGNFRKKVD